MKTIKILFCSIMMFAAISCKQNEPSLNLTPKDALVVDMQNKYQTVLPIGGDSLILDEYNFLTSANGQVDFLHFGKVNYLIEIDDIPDNKWYSKISLVPYNGYILFFDNGKEELARLMVTNYYEDEQHNISGARIILQYPWTPNK